MPIGILPRRAVKFSIGEQEFIDVLMRQFGLTQLAAIEHVLRYKAEQVVYYEMQGNEAMVKQLKRELGEI